MNNYHGSNNNTPVNIGDKCGFCGTPVITGDITFRSLLDNQTCICNSCVVALHSLLEEANLLPRIEQVQSEDIEKKVTLNSIPTPKEINKILDDYVVGQDEAKKTLSVAIYNHYKRIRNNLKIKNQNDKIKKSNVLILGPTGSGKTLIAQVIAELIKVPFVITTATDITKKGYVGGDAEGVLVRLIKAANYDEELAQRGIIYIDEIDKIAKDKSKTSGKDVSGEGAQQDLLKIIEGSVCDVNVDGEIFELDTRDILFICGGAFDGIEECFDETHKVSNIGFGATLKNKEAENFKYAQVTTAELIKYGLIPEFIGRIPSIAALEKLNREEMAKIVKEPKNSILREYQKLVKLDGITLRLDDSALEAIVNLAMKEKTGARSIRGILERVLRDTMYELPSQKNVKECIITSEVVLENKLPKFIYKKAKNNPKDKKILDEA